MPTISNQPAFDMDVGTPEQVAQNLRYIADRYAEARSELQAAWQDQSAGLIWSDFARILSRAADACDRAMSRRRL